MHWRGVALTLEAHGILPDAVCMLLGLMGALWVALLRYTTCCWSNTYSVTMNLYSGIASYRRSTTMVEVRRTIELLLLLQASGGEIGRALDCLHH